MRTMAVILTMLLPTILSAQQKPTTGYAPVNGLKMYYEIHGSGDAVVLLHGSSMPSVVTTTTAFRRRSWTRSLGSRAPAAVLERWMSWRFMEGRRLAKDKH